MKKSELLFTTLLVPLDFVGLFLAGLSAYGLRFQTFVTDLMPVIFNLPYHKFIIISLMIIPYWLIIFALSGLYSFRRRKITSDLTKIFISCSAATLIIVVAFFFNTQLFSSRFIILAAWLAAVVYISLERLAVHLIKKIFYYKGYGVTRIVVVGQAEARLRLKEEFFYHPSFGFRLAGEYSEWSETTKNELNQLLLKEPADELIYLAHGQEEELIEVQKYCLNHYLTFKYATPLLATRSSRVEFDFVAGLPLVSCKETPLDGWGRVVKRICDLIISLLGIIILLPIFIILAIIIKLDSRGPVFVRLNRIGAKRQLFGLYKFRSMVINAHEIKLSGQLNQFNERRDGPLFKMKNDPRITQVGKWLRRFSLDELPQLFNILVGQMSLVGPRPHEPEEVSRYRTDDRRLLAIKPGLTGLAQISGRSDLPWEEEVKLDLYYIENWSIGLDLQILLKTPLTILRRRTAE
ncbi:MAG: sugar transferase [Candidatus Komeilibacteria bacterium]|nr:sugar transferase [Candidatus Komeilibacteria bacterium]